MIKIFKQIIVLSIVFATVSVSAQTTVNSPYSQFGLGELKGSGLPQNRAMGGISMGVRKTGGYSNINLANPASYSSIQLTTFDVGAYVGLRQLSTSTVSQNSYNGTLSHVTFAVPINKKSAVSFGLVPFSDFGYQYKNVSKIDTNSVNYVYSGDGGLSKAYAGYGFLIGKNLSLGFNVGYLFGDLRDARSTEFPKDPTALNSRTQNSRSISGFSYDYGLQYEAKISSKTKLIIGYTGNAGSKINSSNSILNSHYRKNYSTGDESLALDSTFFSEGLTNKIKLPLTHTLGFAFEKTNKWLVGADVSYSKWSEYREGNTNPGFNDSYGLSLGAQITPDITAVSNYLKVIDYRFGFKYDKTYIQIGNKDINQHGFTVGLGLPLQPSRSTFYKINFSAELGQRGTLENNLVKERYVNLTLGFTLNDKWFIKSKID